MEAKTTKKKGMREPFPRCPVFTTTGHIQTADKPSICRSRLMIHMFDSLIKHLQGQLRKSLQWHNSIWREYASHCTVYRSVWLLQRNLCKKTESKKMKIFQNMKWRLYILAIKTAPETAEWKVLWAVLGYFELPVTLLASSDCFFSAVKLAQGDKRSGFFFWSWADDYGRALPPGSTNRAVQRASYSSSLRLALFLLQISGLFTVWRAVCGRSVSSIHTVSDSGSSRWRGAGVVRLLLFLISEPLSLGEVGPGWQQLGYLLVLSGSVNFTGRHLPTGNARRPPIHVPDAHPRKFQWTRKGRNNSMPK